MVTIVETQVRINADGKEFVALILQGDIVMVQSQETGRYYATAKRCSIPSSFTPEMAQGLIGREIPGHIYRVDCEPYEYTVQETGEVITLNHTWEYLPEGAPTPLRVVHKEAA